MKFFILSSLVTLVAGQGIYGPAPGPTGGASSSPAASPTSVALPTASSASQHIVAVGGGTALMFNPSNVTANMNDTVTFVFMSSFNHSVSQSTFDNPCTLADGGFNSGLQPAGNSFTITVTNNTAPIWVFCEQTVPLGHCGMGMVFAINPPASGNTFSSFLAKASSIGTNEGPQTGSPALSGIGAFATASAAPMAGSTPSGAERLALGLGALFAGVSAALYTLA